MTEEIKNFEAEMKKKAEAEAARYQAKYASTGKLSPRARLALLFDSGSYTETGALARGSAGVDGDAVITAYGQINGKPAYAYCQDYTLMGGSLGRVHADKITRIQEQALRAGAPVIALLESGGARIQEGIASLDGYGRIFSNNVKSSGKIPQIAIVFGACAGGASYSPALMDFIITVQDKSKMFITGPEVIKTVIGEEVSMQELGGTDALGKKSGISHFTAADEKEAVSTCRSLLSYLQAVPAAPVKNSGDIMSVLPESERGAYDMRKLIACVFDQNSILEVQQGWAMNAVTAFARLSGYPVAVVASQPMAKAGCIDIDASDKMSRFVRTADAFGLPVITFVDTPGYLPGVSQEHGGIIRHGAKLLYAYAEASVCKVTVIVRKAFGGAYIAMGSKAIGADHVFAYPFCEIAVMGAEGAVKIVNKKELAAGVPAEELIREYKKNLMSPEFAAHENLIDEIILPSQTRERISQALMAAGRTEAGSHGNIPL